jgi:hypothetical protein
MKVQSLLLTFSTGGALQCRAPRQVFAAVNAHNVATLVIFGDYIVDVGQGRGRAGIQHALPERPEIGAAIGLRSRL